MDVWVHMSRTFARANHYNVVHAATSHAKGLQHGHRYLLTNILLLSSMRLMLDDAEQTLLQELALFYPMKLGPVC